MSFQIEEDNHKILSSCGGKTCLGSNFKTQNGVLKHIEDGKKRYDKSMQQEFRSKLT